MLTDKQKANIYNLDFETSFEILQIIADRWGIVSPREYANIMNMAGRTVYANMDAGKIKTIDFLDHKYPVINL